MSDNIHGNQMIVEEKKAAKLFIWLFYIIFFTYELFYHYIGPLSLGDEVGFPKYALGVWYYVLLLGLWPWGIYLIKKGEPKHVKYLFFVFYTISDFLNVLLTYFDKNGQAISFGNILDIFLILFSSIFVNKRYVWIIALGTILKYLLIGIIFKEINVLLPIGIFMFLLIFSLMILSRFMSYIQSLTAAYEEIRDKEKLAFIGQMATVIGHEIRNPLAALKGFTQLQSEQDERKNTFYPVMIQEIDRINTIVDDLMIIGRPKSPNFKPQDLCKIIQYVFSVTNQLAENYGSIIVLKDCDVGQQIECDEKQMKQVLINIIKNAIESMPNGGTVEVSCAKIGDDKLKIMVQDNGCGIDSEMLQKLGEPFYTTKPEGTGLGLLVTKKIIGDHQGELRFDSELGKGTKVEIILPVKHKHN